MNDRNCEILMEYLKNILFERNIRPLDLTELDEAHVTLGKGLQFLHSVVEEMLEYSAELSKGNLSAKLPEKDNFLCTNLKNMHSTLNHLTWQAKQVASGDYSQQVSYLGEFSESFNTMTEQLKERESRISRKAEELQKRSESITAYNELLVQITANIPEWTLVVDAATTEVVYCNKADTPEELDLSPCEHCAKCRSGKSEILAWNKAENEVWEFTPLPNKYFRVSSNPLEWHGQNSYVHIVTDITAQKLEHDYLSNKAYFDPVTSIHNRLFFEEYMEKILAEKRTVTLAYIDLDGLKYVNDNYNHSEGDAYIMSFADLIRKNFRKDDIFARIGGDEFCVILDGDKCVFTIAKLEQLRNTMIETNTKEYPVSFSYGVHTVDGSSDNITFESIMNEADSRMYEYKRANKKARI